VRLEKHPARLREDDLAAGAAEEIRTELRLELPDRDTQRRLRHPQPPGGAAEVELFRDGDEVPEVAQLGHLPSVLLTDTKSVWLET